MKARLDTIVSLTETTGIDPAGHIEEKRVIAWKSRSGRITKLTELETSHLRNILRMLFRFAFARELEKVARIPNEVAAEHEDPIFDRSPSASLVFEIEGADALVNEWARRGFVESDWTQGALS